MVHTRESFKFVQFARDSAPKCLTGLMLWSILQGKNSAPENELHPCPCIRR